ncbi:MAG: Fic family protein [Acidobacteria bacterium]|nr:Fic family protein [Acidobacteriota bacterium]
MSTFYTEISQFEPLIPADTRELENTAFDLAQTSAGLATKLHPITLDGVRELLRVINSYYSNLIEGNNTHPIDVERAMHKDYSNDPAKRDRQIESLIHIDVQKKIDLRLENEPETDVSGPDFLLWIHREFYTQMPESLRWVEGEDGNKEWVEAGEFRRRPVAVGQHLPPEHEAIPAFLCRFDEFYDPEQLHGTKKIVAIAAAHHRLMWIHPFLDGNGRVARLFTDAFFRRIGLEGYGLWNVSRGLARRNREYKKNLDAADFPREDDLDGRGNLSNRTLTEFCKFFLDVCLDQTKYMSSILALGDLLPRMDSYVAKRSEGSIVDEKGVKALPMHPRASFILREAAIVGELPRNKIVEIVGMSERSARTVAKSLIDEGLLIPTTDWHRSPLRLGFPPHAAGYWFPNLFPEKS